MRAFFFFVFFDMSVEVTGTGVWFLVGTASRGAGRDAGWRDKSRGS